MASDVPTPKYFSGWSYPPQWPWRVIQPMAASAKMPVEAKPFPPGHECCFPSSADTRSSYSILILPWFTKADLRHPTFELIYYEAQFAILLQWLCQRPIEPWMSRSVSSNPNQHLGLVSRCWGLRWISPPFTFPCQSTGCCHVMGWELGLEMNGIN